MSNRSEVLAALEEIVAGHEADVADCFYTPPDSVGEESAAPMCVVGHLIHRLEPDVFRVIARDDEANGMMIGGLEGHGILVEFVHDDPELLDALEVMQSVQDAGDSWGTAYAAFLKHLEPSDV